MVVTEAELREMWRDGRNALPAFPPGTRFSPAAQDFIKDHRLEIRFADPAPVPLPSPQLPITNYQLPAPTYQSLSSPQLPVTSYQLLCSLDALFSLTQLVAAEARHYQLPALAGRLDGLASYSQELRAAERQGRLPALLPMPAGPGGGADFAPGPRDHAILHWLNFLRASARQTGALAQALGGAELAAGLEQLAATAADLGRRVQSSELGWNAALGAA